MYSSIEPSGPSPNIEVDSKHRCTLYKAENQVLGLPRPSIEHITFPCQADTLRVMPRTRVLYDVNKILFTVDSSWLWLIKEWLCCRILIMHVFTFSFDTCKKMTCWHFFYFCNLISLIITQQRSYYFVFSSVCPTIFLNKLII